VIVTCEACGLKYDDVEHYTFCPHASFTMRALVMRGDGQVKVCTTIREVHAFIREGDPQA